jgi:hypothetical protein
MSIAGVWTMEDVDALRASGRRDVAKLDVAKFMADAEGKFGNR